MAKLKVCWIRLPWEYLGGVNWSELERGEWVGRCVEEGCEWQRDFDLKNQKQDRKWLAIPCHIVCIWTHTVCPTISYSCLWNTYNGLHKKVIRKTVRDTAIRVWCCYRESGPSTRAQTSGNLEGTFSGTEATTKKGKMGKQDKEWFQN